MNDMAEEKQKKEETQRRPLNGELIKAYLKWKGQKELLYVIEEKVVYFRHDKGHWSPMVPELLQQDIYGWISEEWNRPGGRPKKVSAVNPTQGMKKELANGICDLAGCGRIGKALPSMTDEVMFFDDCAFDFDQMDFISLTDAKKKYGILYFPINAKSSDRTCPPIFRGFMESSLVLKDDTSKFDPQLIDLVQEIIGWFLYPTNPNETMIATVGEGSNGKGVLLHAIEDMLGEQYCSQYSVQDLTTNKFHVPGLIGKRANIPSEQMAKYGDPSMWRALVSQERITGTHKYGADIHIRPKVKFGISHNEPITFDAPSSYSIVRRILNVPFYRKFEPKDKDLKLRDKIRSEIPQIIMWALDGLIRLHRNNFVWSQSSASEAVAKENLLENSSAARFMAETCAESDELFVPTAALYSAYKGWCDENGNKKMNEHRFGREVSGVYGSSSMERFGTGNPVRGRWMSCKCAYYDPMRTLVGKKPVATKYHYDPTCPPNKLI